MRRIHFISGLIITIFIGLHLLNHLTSVLGEGVHIEVMYTLRILYRNIFIESILLIAVFLQIISGINLFLSKRKYKTNNFIKLQIWSGMYLAIFLILHVGAVLTGRFILHLDTNIYFGVAGLNTFPFNLFFLPYYALAILSFFGHLAAIHHQKMKAEVLGFSVSQQSKFILIVGLLVTAITFYGLTNGFKGIDIPEAYHVLIGK